jgi:hypothetical protein
LCRCRQMVLFLGIAFVHLSRFGCWLETEWVGWKYGNGIRIIRYPYPLKHKYGYPYSNSNVVVKWIHPIRFCRFFSIWFHVYSAIFGTIRIRLYKIVSYVYN